MELDSNVDAQSTRWHLPDSPWSANGGASVCRLLSHTAEIGVHGFEGYLAGAPVPSIVQILDSVAPANSSAVRSELQQLMIDRIGTPYAVTVRDSVFESLAMCSSTLDQPLPSAWTSRAAAGHDALGSVIEGRWRTLPELAAAGSRTTPSDLARFLLGIERTRLGKPHAILKPETVAQMSTRQLGQYGLGFGLRGNPDVVSFGHGGANIGYRAVMR